MSPLTCPDVAERLDLYAADECDPAEADAIRRHLADCPQCAVAATEARQLMELLDLRLQEPERLRRLQDRLAAEDKPRRHVLRFPTGLRRVVALAALLLLTVGLLGWLTRGLQPVDDNSGLTVALEYQPPPVSQIARGVPEIAHPTQMKEPRGPFEADAKEPPPVDLSLHLHNTSDHPLRVWVAGPKTDLSLDVSGPGVKSVPAKERDPAEPNWVELRPGAEHVIHITNLVDDHYSWYLTKPGDYTVSAQFTTRAAAPGMAERRVTVHSESIVVPHNVPLKE
jgi:hypothetical protein